MAILVGGIAQLCERVASSLLGGRVCAGNKRKRDAVVGIIFLRRFAAEDSAQEGTAGTAAEAVLDYSPAECWGDDWEAGTEDADSRFDGSPDDEVRVVPFNPFRSTLKYCRGKESSSLKGHTYM